MCPTNPDVRSSETGSRASTPITLPEIYTRQIQREPGIDESQTSTGVIWANERAEELGYEQGDPDWVNLGQGAPESGHIPGALDRPTSIPLSEKSKDYGSTAGIKELREAVAHLYNSHYRQGKESQYTYENVCIVPGGRAGLIRIAAILQNCYLSFFFPDYTAYSEMLSLFKNFSPIPVPLDETDRYHIHLDIIKNELHRGVTALLTSNPRNPTGQCLRGKHLRALQDMCRKTCLIIMDEFYSRYNYVTDCDGSGISAAANIIDVNDDYVLILDGMTKSFRLPGWRVCWILGPKPYIKALSSAGSYLDGGCNVAFQEASIPFLEPKLVIQEMSALQVHFKAKRDYCIERLQKMGFVFKYVPDFTFYLWLDLSPMPSKINSGLGFFKELLKEKTMVVPGIFFDLNPLARREVHHSPMFKFIRLSYGPEMSTLTKGLDAIERVIAKHK